MKRQLFRYIDDQTLIVTDWGRTLILSGWLLMVCVTAIIVSYLSH